jgi:organic radical activating enzyme
MKDNFLLVSESFYSLQGEGQTMGVPSVFLRLGGCNLLCKSKTWICDTIEVWQKSKRTYFEDVLDEYIEQLRHGAHLVITGGEPLLHQDAIHRYLTWFFVEYGFNPIVEIETNGTIMPSLEMLERVQFWNCSPKLENSGEPYEKRVKLNVIEVLRIQPNAIFKFVVSSPGDVLDIMQDYGESIDMSKVVLMPAGETQDKLNETRPIVVAEAMRLGVRYCDRLHIVIWNQKTGV